LHPDKSGCDIVDTVRSLEFALCCTLVELLPSPSFAQDPERSPDVHIEIAPKPPGVDDRRNGAEPAEPADSIEQGAAPEGALGEAPAPPLPPHHKGLVLESTLGVLAFAGQFRHVAPPAPFVRTLLGYELLQWLMVFGETELAFTDTSESQDASQSRAFALWGFGGGVRAGLHIGSFGVFVQADVGALAAEVPHDALAYLGFRQAESLGAQFGGRVGIEWYQRDRHLALTLQGGPRVAQGFSKLAASGDLPLMWDAAAGLRYTF
jgi:hypothetical protein